MSDPVGYFLLELDHATLSLEIIYINYLTLLYIVPNKCYLRDFKIYW